jgi:hypothetical protein
MDWLINMHNSVLGDLGLKARELRHPRSLTYPAGILNYGGALKMAPIRRHLLHTCTIRDAGCSLRMTDFAEDSPDTLITISNASGRPS